VTERCRSLLREKKKKIKSGENMSYYICLIIFALPFFFPFFQNTNYFSPKKKSNSMNLIREHSLKRKKGLKKRAKTNQTVHGKRKTKTGRTYMTMNKNTLKIKKKEQTIDKSNYFFHFP